MDKYNKNKFKKFFKKEKVLYIVLIIFVIKLIKQVLYLHVQVWKLKFKCQF